MLWIKQDQCIHEDLQRNGGGEQKCSATKFWRMMIDKDTLELVDQ